MNVFIVTEGQYPNYHICAVFNNFSIAKSYQERYCNNCTSMIQIWVVEESATSVTSEQAIEIASERMKEASNL